MVFPHPWQNFASIAFCRPHSGQYRPPDVGPGVAAAAMLCRAWAKVAAISGGICDEAPRNPLGVAGDLRPFATIPSPNRQTMVPTPNPANPKHCGDVALAEVPPEHEGYPTNPGRLTPATTPFVETSRMPNPRTTTPRISDSSRIRSRATDSSDIDLPNGREGVRGRPPATRMPNTRRIPGRGPCPTLLSS